MSKYFKTSDGEQFYTENHAQMHAKSLQDKTITPPTVEVEKVQVDEVQVEGVEVEGAEVVGAELKLIDMTKAQLIAFAADKEISIDPKATNPIIIETIELQLTPKEE